MSRSVVKNHIKMHSTGYKMSDIGRFLEKGVENMYDKIFYTIRS